MWNQILYGCTCEFANGHGQVSVSVSVVDRGWPMDLAIACRNGLQVVSAYHLGAVLGWVGWVPALIQIGIQVVG